MPEKIKFPFETKRDDVATDVYSDVPIYTLATEKRIHIEINDSLFALEHEC